MGKGVVYAEFWWGNLKEGLYSEDLGVDWRTVVKWMFKKYGRTWTGLIWLRIRTNG
jgi:hypothetical protein